MIIVDDYAKKSINYDKVEVMATELTSVVARLSFYFAGEQETHINYTNLADAEAAFDKVIEAKERGKEVIHI